MLTIDHGEDEPKGWFVWQLFVLLARSPLLAFALVTVGLYLSLLEFQSAAYVLSGYIGVPIHCQEKPSHIDNDVVW